MSAGATNAGRLFVAIPGWGTPHLAAKRAILANNLRAIARGPWQIVTVRLFQYDASDSATAALAEALSAAPRGLDVQVRVGPGIVGEFLRTGVRPDDPDVAGADAVLLLLDDVELTASIDFASARRILRDFGPNALVVPALTPDSLHVFPHMIARPEPRPGECQTVTVTSVAEFFAYLMTPTTYARYHGFLCPDNPWMWGTDLILTRRMGLRVLLLNAQTVRHHFRGAGDRAETYGQRARYLAAHGETEASAAEQPAWLYTILAGPAESRRDRRVPSAADKIRRVK